MAYTWRTQIIPTPAQPGAHFYNPVWDTNFGFTAMVEASTPTGYTPAGPNTYVPVAIGLDIFGFTLATSQIDSFTAPAGTSRYQVIVPADNQPVGFYNKSTGANTSALERDVITVNPDGSLSHSIAPIVASITGTIEGMSGSYRSGGTGAGTYSIAYSTYDSATQTADGYFQVFNPNHTASSTLIHPLHVTGVATEASTPEFQFRSGGGQYVSMTELANHSLQFQVYNIDGTTAASSFNIATGSTDVTSAKFTQYSASPSRFFVVYNEKNGATDNVVLKVYTPGTGVTNTQTFNIASGAEQKVRIALDSTLGTAIIAYGDDTATTLREFDSTGALLDTIVLSGIPFMTGGIERGNGLGSLDDGRVLVASQPDLNTTTTSVTLTTVDFRTTGLNIDNHTVAAGTQTEYAGTKFVDTVLGGNGADVFMGMDGNDSFNGGNAVNAGEVDVAVFQNSRADYLVQTIKVGGVLKTFVTQQAGALADGGDTLTSTELLWFNPSIAPDPTKFEAGHAFFNFGSQLNHHENVDGQRFDDVVFRSVSTGQVIFQNMNAGAALGFDAITNPLSSQWVAVGTGDVSGDGKADVVIWNSTNGFVYSVLPGASASPTYGLLAGGINGTYSALGVSDINGDGTVDLLVREANTGSIFWENPTNSVWAYVGINLGASWSYQAAGDVNRDGFADVAIRDTSGLVYIANMANGQNSGYITLGNLTGYQVRAIADVNADGFADVIVQRESDGWTLWRDLSGNGPAWNVATNPVGTDWIVKGAADVDNDGSADLIFQHSATGETLYRAMDLGVGTSWQVVSTPLGTEWVVV